MKNKSILIILSLLVLVVLSACAAGVQSPAPAEQVNRTINVTGRGQVYLAPDIAYIMVGVRTEADIVSDALSQNNQQAQAIASTLGEMGVAREDIQTTAFNVYPYETYSQMGEPLGTKYVVENTVLVTARDLSRLGEILDRVVRSGANSINSIQFDVANKEAALSEARRLAVESGQALAEELAAAAGVELDGLFNLYIYQLEAPAPVYDTSGKGGGVAVMGSEVPVAAGQLVITAEASLIYLIK